MIGNVDGIDNDYIAGWAMEPDDETYRVPLDVFYNGALFTQTIASYHRDDLARAHVGDGSNGFYVAMPALANPEHAEVEVRVQRSGERVGEIQQIARRPKCSAHGVLAADMLRLQPFPLHSIQSVAFDGDRLLVQGIHLPPYGNPFVLRVRSSPGTVFDVTYPQHVRNVGDWYWYWPNGSWCGFRIDIDLAASTDDRPFFEFYFEYDGSDESSTALGRNRIWIPKDIGAFQTFPHGDQLTRVQRFDHPRRVALSGYTDYRRMRLIAEEYGVDLPAANVLDWGCGHGRVVRHFAREHAVTQAWGVDIDAENVGWLAENLPGIHASAVPLLPPSDLPSSHFDFVYAISVMTHLTHDMQEAWLAEIKRIAKPGAIIALTFAGPASVAFASKFLTPAYVQTWQSTGFDDSLPSEDLVDKIADADYYRNTKQSAQYTRELWGRYFEVIDIHPCAFGYQDIAILRA
ncbi:MAG TPA: class I SAM-dependent methyltransferase [Jatrophihabitantaceae bacterium]|nr:class I SAM-dependent methyltransferase [Jatrophihabitantaceae bacterium]